MLLARSCIKIYDSNQQSNLSCTFHNPVLVQLKPLTGHARCTQHIKGFGALRAARCPKTVLTRAERLQIYC
jgi:hypothetical protein